MEFNLVSKNNLGVVTALLLVIILSQGRFFNFLLDTALGRAILILFILFISYTNKILGVVSVLFIIIMFNNSNFGYMEGATTMGSSMGTTMSSSTGTNMGPNMGSSMGPNMGSMKKDDSKKAPASTHTPAAPAKKTVEGGSEGSNLPETERSFGKPSNSMPPIKTSTDGFEAFSGSYNQHYSQY
jgi:hypothetical protein